MSRLLLILTLLLVPDVGYAHGDAPEHEHDLSELAPRTVERPAPIPTPEWFELDGHLLTRWGLLMNMDLDRGLTPSTGQPIFPVPLNGGQLLGSADARVRLDLGVHVGQLVAAHVRIDALDGLALGSTPEGFPADRWAQAPWAGLGQVAPSAGRNAFVDSIKLEHAWGEVMTPIGALVFGRMPLPRWGLGIVTGGDEDLDDDFDHAVDRLGFATSLADHILGVSLDINAIGPTTATSTGGSVGREQVDLALQDNLYTVSLSFARLHDDASVARRRVAGKPTFAYGSYATFRFQQVDFPTYYLGGIESEDETFEDADAVARNMWALMVDGWFRANAGPLRVELELAYMHAHVGDASLVPGISVPTLRGDQVGAALELEGELARNKLWLELGAGLATGDPAPGLGVAPAVGQVSSVAGDLDGPQFDLSGDSRIDNFRFHPNFRIDQVFWRRIVGAVTDAVYVRPALTWRPNPTLELGLSGTVSLAMRKTSTPGDHPLYGGEIDLSMNWSPAPGFVARVEGALFVPGAGLHNVAEGLGAKPAGLARTVLAVVF